MKEMGPSEKEKKRKLPSTDAAVTEYKASIFPGPSDKEQVPVKVAENVKALEEAMGKQVWLLVHTAQSPSTVDYDDLREPVRAMFYGARDKLPNEQIALLIRSPGGHPDAAYRLATLLRRHCGGFVAVVPSWAKSAATLLALGADEIVLGDSGELGPLDVQLPVPQGEDYASALNEYQALYRLSEFALDAFNETMFQMQERFEDLTDKELMPFAIRFALGMMRPLLDDLDSVHYTYISRELRLIQEYAVRLMRRTYKEEEARKIARHLVENYYDHGFVIDAGEAENIGLRTVKKPPSLEQGRILSELATQLDGLYIFGRVEETSDGGHSR